MIGKETFETSEIKKLLEQEFLVHTDAFGEAEYGKVRKALFVYKSVEAFNKATGWGRDNPELCTEDYLTRHRICRWWNGRFIYFSRILWENEMEMGWE